MKYNEFKIMKGIEYTIFRNVTLKMLSLLIQILNQFFKLVYII